MNEPAELTPDDSIPVLTERLTLPPLELDTTLPQEASDETAYAAAPAPATAAKVDEPLAKAAKPDEVLAKAAPAFVLPPMPLTSPAPLAAVAAARAPAQATAPIPVPMTATRLTAALPPSPSSAGRGVATSLGSGSSLGERAVAAEIGAPGAHWTRIELELRASILQDIAESLPREVDAIVRSRMSEAVDRLMSQLAAETRLALAASLRDIVEHAVRSELDRLRGRKR
jgi:hypothetical protein